MNQSTKVKGKKVSLKHFINTSLKERVEADGVIKYPLYTQVLYDRNNIKFKSSLNPSKGERILVPYRPDLPNKFEEVKDPRLAEVDAKILNIIKYEVEKNGSSFKLAGLGFRLQVYFQSVEAIIQEQILMGYDVAAAANRNSKKDEMSELIIDSALTNNLIHILVQTFNLEQDKITCYHWLIEGVDKDFERFISTKGGVLFDGYIDDVQQLADFAPKYITNILGYTLLGEGS